jgi:hypothetical protein
VRETSPVLVSTETTCKYKCPHSKNGVEYVETYVTDIEKPPFFQKSAPTHTPSGTLLPANIPWNELNSKNFHFSEEMSYPTRTGSTENVSGLRLPLSLVRYETLIWGHGG